MNSNANTDSAVSHVCSLTHLRVLFVFCSSWSVPASRAFSAEISLWMALELLPSVVDDAELDGVEFTEPGGENPV